MRRMPTSRNTKHKTGSAAGQWHRPGTKTLNSRFKPSSGKLLKPEDNFVRIDIRHTRNTGCESILLFHPDNEMSTEGIGESRNVFQNFAPVGIGISVEIALVVDA